MKRKPRASGCNIRRPASRCVLLASRGPTREHIRIACRLPPPTHAAAASPSLSHAPSPQTVAHRGYERVAEKLGSRTRAGARLLGARRVRGSSLGFQTPIPLAQTSLAPRSADGTTQPQQQPQQLGCSLPLLLEGHVAARGGVGKGQPETEKNRCAGPPGPPGPPGKADTGCT